MPRTNLVVKKKFKPAGKLETMTDEDSVRWVQTYPGNWEKYLVWRDKMNQKKEFSVN